MARVIGGGSAMREEPHVERPRVELAGFEEFQAVLQRIVQGAVQLVGADMGSIQILDNTGALRIVAQTGFKQDFINFFNVVDAHTHTACGRALAARRRVVCRDVERSPIFRDSPALPQLRLAGVRALQSTPLLDLKGAPIGMFSTHYRRPLGLENVDLNMLDPFADVAAIVIERTSNDEELVKSRNGLEMQVRQRTQWLALMHAVSQSINKAQTWDEALHLVLSCLCQTDKWQVGYVYLPDVDDPTIIAPAISCYEGPRFAAFHDLCERLRFRQHERLPGQVFADGVARWLNGEEEIVSAFPLRQEAARQAGLKAAILMPVEFERQVIAVMELFSDQLRPPNDELLALMKNVSDQIGRVIERERSTRQMADLLWREQHELLYTLHDSLGQTLTGLGMLSTALGQRISNTDAGALEITQQISQQASEALQQVRRLSNGLFPMEVTGDALAASLRQLATTTTLIHKVRVHVDLRGGSHFDDVAVGTQLYRIVQEAITNVVKHAHAHSIWVELENTPNYIRASVRDDGIGIEKSAGEHGGLGLRIMEHRARSIGGQLRIEPVPEGGTVVTCIARKALKHLFRKPARLYRTHNMS